MNIMFLLPPRSIVIDVVEIVQILNWHVDHPSIPWLIQIECFFLWIPKTHPNPKNGYCPPCSPLTFDQGVQTQNSGWWECEAQSVLFVDGYVDSSDLRLPASQTDLFCLEPCAHLGCLFLHQPPRHHRHWHEPWTQDSLNFPPFGNLGSSAGKEKRDTLILKKGWIWFYQSYVDDLSTAMSKMICLMSRLEMEEQ